MTQEEIKYRLIHIGIMVLMGLLIYAYWTYEKRKISKKIDKDWDTAKKAVSDRVDAMPEDEAQATMAKYTFMELVIKEYEEIRDV